MGETLASQKMEKIDLLNSLERISAGIPNRILKAEGYILKKKQKEQLEIIIFKGFSSSTTHTIEMNLEKKIIAFEFIFTNFRLYEFPFKGPEDKSIRESQKLLFFLNHKNWI